MKNINKIIAMGFLGIGTVINSGCGGIEEVKENNIGRLDLTEMVKIDENKFNEVNKINGETHLKFYEKIEERQRVKDEKIKFEKIDVNYDSYKGGEEGIAIRTTFIANNLFNKNLRVDAYFYLKNGEKLRDADGKYGGLDGQVMVTGDSYYSPHENSMFRNIELFMPYSQLDLKGDKKYNLKFRLECFDVTYDGDRLLGKSEFKNFDYEKR